MGGTACSGSFGPERVVIRSARDRAGKGEYGKIERDDEAADDYARTRTSALWEVSASTASSTSSS